MEPFYIFGFFSYSSLILVKKMLTPQNTFAVIQAQWIFMGNKILKFQVFFFFQT